MLAWGSELRFSRRCTSLTLLLTSANSASSWPSSTEAVKIRPTIVSSQTMTSVAVESYRRAAR